MSRDIANLRGYEIFLYFSFLHCLQVLLTQRPHLEHPISPHFGHLTTLRPLELQLGHFILAPLLII